VTLKAAVSLDGCIARKPGERTQLTSAAANRHAHRIRAEVDAIAVGVGTILVDDPLLTARGAYRERPLTRVIFDRSLRTPGDARLLSTRAAGPVMIVTTPGGADRMDRRRQLEQHGAQIVVAGSIRGALEMLGQHGVNALLLEGGATLQEAAVAEGVVDFVRLYVAPQSFGERGVKFLNGRQFNVTELADRRMERLGPDTLIEGYVHGSG
jgi:diaminohydroxyphosphoribosylaminopyrimidine deaminase/5-amino-6-(5-phosphoribosylamino)uracil reductase